MRIKEKLSCLIALGRIIEEAGLKKEAIRKGKIVQVIDCGPGKKYKDGKCVPQTAADKLSYARAAKKSQLTRQKNSAKNKISSAKSRTLSLTVRNKNKSRLTKPPKSVN